MPLFLSLGNTLCILKVLFSKTFLKYLKTESFLYAQQVYTRVMFDLLCVGLLPVAYLVAEPRVRTVDQMGEVGHAVVGDLEQEEGDDQETRIFGQAASFFLVSQILLLHQTKVLITPPIACNNDYSSEPPPAWFVGYR